jgi:hypothetical protein
MSKERIVTKIGNIFEVTLKSGERRYFQYIANDLTQLNSSVIRVFKRKYATDEKVDFEALLESEVEFNVHTMLKPGIQLGYWRKVGTSDKIGNPSNILFRETEDSGRGVNDQPVLISHKWFVWRIGEEYRNVGRLVGENRLAEQGGVMPPIAIMNRLETGDYQYFIPGFE